MIAEQQTKDAPLEQPLSGERIKQVRQHDKEVQNETNNNDADGVGADAVNGIGNDVVHRWGEWFGWPFRQKSVAGEKDNSSCN